MGRRKTEPLRLQAAYEYLSDNQYRVRLKSHTEAVWAEVTDRWTEGTEGPAKPTDETFGALVPWDGVDFGPERF